MGINALGRGCPLEIAHGGDAVTFDCQVAVMPGCAGAINYPRAGDDEIISGLLSVGWSVKQRAVNMQSEIDGRGRRRPMNS